jgi:hypothetical protein
MTAYIKLQLITCDDQVQLTRSPRLLVKQAEQLFRPAVEQVAFSKLWLARVDLAAGMLLSLLGPDVKRVEQTGPGMNFFYVFVQKSIEVYRNLQQLDRQTKARKPFKFCS